MPKKKKNQTPEEEIVKEPQAEETAAEEAGQQAVEDPAAAVAAAEEAAAKLDAAEKKAEEYLNMAQRVQADFDNFRRRNQNTRKEAFDDGTREFVSVLLPVVDNLERAIQAAQNSPDEALRSGVEMVYRQLCDVFQKRGIETIDRAGEKFDPNLENAVMQGSPDEGEPGTVCAVLQKGYRLEGTVIRHAMVKVVPE